MIALTTTILRHVTTRDTHWDWLTEFPARIAAPDGRLWTVRVPVDPHFWRRAGAMIATELPPHRRHYLSWQGPIGGGRGEVQRVARGFVLAELWTASRMRWLVHMPAFTGTIELDRLTPDRWRLCCRPYCASAASPSSHGRW